MSDHFYDFFAKGKAVFATAAIPKDQAIFEEEPLVCSQFLWNEIYKYKACEYCLRSLESAQEMGRRLTDDSSLVLPYPESCSVVPEEHVKCPMCGADYCSSACQKKALEKYHETLCTREPSANESHPINKLKEAWRNVHLPPESCSIMLIAKMIAMVRQSSNKEELLEAFSRFTKATTNEEEHTAHKLLGKEFQSQLELMRNLIIEALFDDSVDQWLTPEGFRSIFALVGRNGQGIGTSSISVWMNTCDSLKLSDGDKEKLNEFLDKFADNLYEISAEFQEVEGSGLYRLQSCCNHSCEPNAEVTFPHNNSTLVLKATTDIAPGEEICISYISECEVERSRHSRQKHLRENYLFTCTCSRCLEQANDPDVTSEEEMEDSD